MAQQKEMITDRPTKTESASVLLINDFQLETGFLYEHFDETRSNTTYNSSLFRYGLFEMVELRLGLEYLGTNVSMAGGEFDVNGFGPIKVGGKLFLHEEVKNSFPELAFITTFSIPKSGANEFENKNPGVDLRLAVAYSLNETMSLGANLGVVWSGRETEDYGVGIYSTVIGLNLSEKVNVFAELYGFCPGEGKNDHRWDGGITYAINDDLQFDFSSGIGLSKVSPDFFISFGLSIRMP